MIQLLRRLFLTLLFLTAGTIAILAQSNQNNGADSPIDIMGTVLDHDNLSTPFGVINLPRIFYWEDAEGSTHLNFYKNTEAAAASDFFSLQNQTVKPVNGRIIVDFSITSHLMYFWISLAIVFIITVLARARYVKGVGKTSAPKGAAQNLFEVFFVFVKDEIVKANIAGDKHKKYVPYLFTVFMGITFMNAFGLMPWAATATADITVTATLAFITLAITQFSGSKEHWRHVFWFPGVPVPIKIMMIPVELIGLFTKPFALAIRLFANMMSGKILIIAMVGLIFILNEMYGSTVAYGVSVFSVVMTATLYVLKLFVALLQAYIFTLLSAVFIGMAAEGEEIHDEKQFAEQTA